MVFPPKDLNTVCTGITGHTWPRVLCRVVERFSYCSQNLLSTNPSEDWGTCIVTPQLQINLKGLKQNQALNTPYIGKATCLSIYTHALLNANVKSTLICGNGVIQDWLLPWTFCCPWEMRKMNIKEGWRLPWWAQWAGALADLSPLLWLQGGLCK